ncbi:TonB-dependent receptor [Novosphingobium resinovorum]|uniref:TonB-dependent receptor n=1 Tax=Novosphingobium resinovorum TaxID=158500 RepID=UPI000690B4A7|nr:TonB-dependent receptor [Novosphingobium resinovorum]
MIAALLAGTMGIFAPSQAWAQDGQSYPFDMPSQDLGDALRSVAARAGWELYALTDDVNGKAAPALRGSLTAREAIERLLQGTKLEARFDKGAVIIRGRREASLADNLSQEPEIVVTGTHIRNAPPAGIMITLKQSDVRNAGQSDLGEVVRSLPSNFGGGQNPGVGTGAGLTNGNVNSASSINLRGLGSDATLTLLNGRRLPYDSAFQGVDISAIPAAAIDRIEIIADGASALYGSDAVAGVANIVLRRDFDGLETSGRIGASTSGGYFQQQATAIGGTRWNSGGIMFTYDFQNNSAIRADSRSYALSLPADNSLYPSQRRHAATLSLHQGISDQLEFSLDALYGRRWSTTIGGYSASGVNLRQYLTPRVETFSIAPEFNLTLANGWRFKAFGTYGTDNTNYDGTIIQGNAPAYRSNGCYCNRALSIEVSADGALFSLPGGSARAAIGGGFRSNRLHFTRLDRGALSQAFSVEQNVYYGFSELLFPLIGPDQGIGGIRRLTFSAAGRYESYPGIGSVATPKLSVIFEPVEDFAIKGSWGRSFKAPTLYQQYVASEVYLLPARSYGAGPAGTTVLYASGGNPDLQPERSQNWAVSVEFKPSWAPGLSLVAGYFDLVYKDRVARPIAGSVGTAFANPAYASLLTQNPSATLLNELIAAAPLGLQNFTGAPYSPSSVVYLVDNRNRNVAQQRIKGVDFAAKYRRDLGNDRAISFDISGTYLSSKQQVIETVPAIDLAGTIFNPPHLRMRGGGTFSSPRLTLSTFVNYIGSVRDQRFSPSYVVTSKTSVDLVARYQLAGQQGQSKSLELGLVINNLFNAKPSVIQTTGPSDTPYDSTNFSPIGRFVALSITRAW